MVAKTSHSPEDRKPLEPGQLGCRVGFDRHLYCLKAKFPAKFPAVESGRNRSFVKTTGT
jgi:hypothetical protein